MFSIVGLLAGPLSAAESTSFQEPRLEIKNATSCIAEATISGPQFFAPEAFHSFEVLESPRVAQLRDSFGFHDVVEDESDEFRKMLRLRHWVHTRWPIDDEQSFSGDAFAILEKAKTGTGFHCSHSMAVQHAVMTVMGFVARDLGVDVNHQVFGHSIHHGVNEIWSNKYVKWVLLDAKYDIHFERDGIPLSALELHEAVRADGGKGIAKVHGPNSEAVPMNGSGFPTSSVSSYWWVSYYVDMGRFTGGFNDSRVVVLDNLPFRETTWMRDSSDGLKKHWGYDANAFLPIGERHRIQWTPGVPELQISQISPSQLDVTFDSETPNLEGYLIRTDVGLWQPVDGGNYVWNLELGRNALEICTRNQLGVLGPPVTVSVVRQLCK